MKKINITVAIILLFSFLSAAEDELTVLIKYLKKHDITMNELENKYSCQKIETVLYKALENIREIESDVNSSRNRIRISALLPKVTAWGKFGKDEKTYLYQQNNISVGKDYITIGPDDNNTTIGNIDTFEVGGRVEFKLSDLLYHPDTIKFSEEETKIAAIKKEYIKEISYIYYYAAVVKALEKNSTDIPAELLIRSEINRKEMTAWLKSSAKINLDSCDEEK